MEVVGVPDRRREGERGVRVTVDPEGDEETGERRAKAAGEVLVGRAGDNELVREVFLERADGVVAALVRQRRKQCDLRDEVLPELQLPPLGLLPIALLGVVVVGQKCGSRVAREQRRCAGSGPVSGVLCPPQGLAQVDDRHPVGEAGRGVRLEAERRGVVEQKGLVAVGPLAVARPPHVHRQKALLALGLAEARPAGRELVGVGGPLPSGLAGEVERPNGEHDGVAGGGGPQQLVEDHLLSLDERLAVAHAHGGEEGE